MAFVTNFYSDNLCKEVQFPLTCGVAGITSEHWNNINNWNVAGTDRAGNKILYAYINQHFSSNEIALSGGSVLFNFDSTTADKLDYFFAHPYSTDTLSNTSQNAYNFVSFFGVNGTASTYLHIERGSQVRQMLIQIGAYHQTPEGSGMNERTAWNHEYSSAPDGFPVTSRISAQFAANTLYGCVKPYLINIFGIDHFMLAFGIDFGGGISPNAGAWPPTFILIPVAMFADKPNKPYVGPVSKDSAASSFSPTTPYRDNITGRNLTGKRNPVGFNSGNGLRLLKLDNAAYSLIVYLIYSGSSSSLINFAGQLIDQVTGGEGHRPAEEVQPMAQGVLCCHILPAITSYAGTSYMLQSIAGYRLSLTGVPAYLCTNSIYAFNSDPVYIERRLNSFLDFEPYTSIICHLPFMGDISLSPSAVYGNAIQAQYELDIYTGILSCNLCIISGGYSYIVSTQQAKIATSLPIIGAAANQNAISTIAQATGGLTRARMQQARAQEVGTQAAQAAAAANTAATAVGAAAMTLDALSRAGNAVPVGGSSVEGIGNYLVSRAAYLIITRPEPSLPEQYAQMQGAVINKSGIVSEFSGYAEFAAVDLSGIDATDAEKAEILATLRGGVFV